MTFDPWAVPMMRGGEIEGEHSGNSVRSKELDRDLLSGEFESLWLSEQSHWKKKDYGVEERVSMAEKTF